MFYSKIVYKKDLGNVAARVNRSTGELQINSSIWDYLKPNEKKFVLWHERGHLFLDTASEFEANKFATDKYLQDSSITNPYDFEQEIIFLSKINSSIIGDDSGNNWSNFDPVTAISTAVGSIFSSLPLMGIGSKARRKEIEATAKGQIDILNAKSKYDKAKAQQLIEIILIIGVVVVIVIFSIKMFKNK